MLLITSYAVTAVHITGIFFIYFAFYDAYSLDAKITYADDDDHDEDEIQHILTVLYNILIIIYK